MISELNPRIQLLNEVAVSLHYSSVLFNLHRLHSFRDYGIFSNFFLDKILLLTFESHV